MDFPKKEIFLGISPKNPPRVLWFFESIRKSIKNHSIMLLKISVLISPLIEIFEDVLRIFSNLITKKSLVAFKEVHYKVIRLDIVRLISN